MGCVVCVYFCGAFGAWGKGFVSLSYLAFCCEGYLFWRGLASSLPSGWFGSHFLNTYMCTFIFNCPYGEC